jgi:hypothetical protein
MTIAQEGRRQAPLLFHPLVACYRPRRSSRLVLSSTN